MKARKIVGAVVTSPGLVVGLSGFAGATTATITNSGNHAGNTVTATNTKVTTLANNNNAGVLNLNGQAGESGNARVRGNNSGGSATSGAVMNSSSTNTSISVSNSGSSAAALAAAAPTASNTATISNSGNNVGNTVTFQDTTQTTVQNTNNVGVANVNIQLGSSGNARVTGNNSGGSATSGAVSNSSNTTTSVSVSN